MDILIRGERVGLPKTGESYIDIRIYETGEIVIDGDQDKTATAIELPPHGRLIDERVAYDKIAEQEGGLYVDMDLVDLGLQETPTVIEASDE